MSIKCVTYGSILYCYDKENKVVYAYPRQEKAINQCPASVINAIINNEYNAEIVIKGNPNEGYRKSTEVMTQDEIDQMLEAVNKAEDIATREKHREPSKVLTSDEVDAILEKKWLSTKKIRKPQ